MSEFNANAGHRSLRGFWSLFATQFQGAFSDNLFKFLVIFLIALPWWSLLGEPIRGS